MVGQWSGPGRRWRTGLRDRLPPLAAGSAMAAARPLGPDRGSGRHRRVAPGLAVLDRGGPSRRLRAWWNIFDTVSGNFAESPPSAPVPSC